MYCKFAVSAIPPLATEQGIVPLDVELGEAALLALSQ